MNHAIGSDPTNRNTAFQAVRPEGILPAELLPSRLEAYGPHRQDACVPRAHYESPNRSMKIPLALVALLCGQAEYVQAVRDIAREESVGLVDVFEAGKKADQQAGRKPGWLCRDGMHPDDDGHRLVANLLIEHLSAADPRFARKPHTAEQVILDQAKATP